MTARIVLHTMLSLPSKILKPNGKAKKLIKIESCSDHVSDLCLQCTPPMQGFGVLRCIGIHGDMSPIGPMQCIFIFFTVYCAIE